MNGTEDRGLTAVVGIVLLVGIVAVGSVTVVVIGGQIQQDTDDRITDERIKDSFIQLDQTIGTVATGQRQEATVDFALSNDADADTAIRREDTGTIVINRTNLTTTKTVAVKDIGSIVYTRDGEQYTYQAGAVWRNTGNATQLVSSPQVSYEFNTQSGYASPTLNLAIPELQGADRISNGAVAVEHNRTIAPFNNVSTVQNQLITMSVTSDFYVGWGKYFEQRYPAITTVSYDHPDETVTIKFGKRDIDGEFDEAILAGGDVTVDTGNPAVEGPVVAGGSVNGGSISCSDTNVTCGGAQNPTVLDSVIASKINEAQSDDPDVTATIDSGNRDASNPLTAGSYYTGGFELKSGQTLTIDLSAGNVSLVVDGPVGISGGRIEVINADQNATCCYARVYVGDSGGNGYGDWAMGGGTSSVSTPGENATRFQVYGTSEMHFAFGQSNGDGFEGVVYAPHDGDKSTGDNYAITTYSLNNAKCSPPSGADVCIGTGNGEFTGAILGFQAVDVRQSSRLEYDSDLETIEPTLGYGGTVPPPITFLQVSVQQVCIGEDTVDCSSAGP